MSNLRVPLFLVIATSLLLVGCGGGGGGGSVPPGGISSEAQAISDMAGGYFGAISDGTTLGFTMAPDGSIANVTIDGVAQALAGSISAENLSRDAWHISWSNGTKFFAQAMHKDGATYLLYVDPTGPMGVLQAGASALATGGYTLGDLVDKIYVGVDVQLDAQMVPYTATTLNLAVFIGGGYSGVLGSGLQFSSEVMQPFNVFAPTHGIYIGSWTHTGLSQVGLAAAIMSPDKRCIVLAMTPNGNPAMSQVHYAIGIFDPSP